MYAGHNKTFASSDYSKFDDLLRNGVDPIRMGTPATAVPKVLLCADSKYWALRPNPPPPKPSYGYVSLGKMQCQ
jgi:hypothetical protein